MTKYIHYCWFGGKPLPKLAKKCLKSWEKYLPDYKIIRWDESNVDINECNFIKDAYKKKKWAFVADYARTKAMYDYGGIYFDTDMEVIKNIDDLLKNNESFLGVEDSHMIACGVWYEKNKHSYLATQMLSFYRQQDSFDIDDLYKEEITIDYDNDGKKERIVMFSNAYNETKTDKAFSYIAILKNNKYNIIYSDVRDANEIYNICNPYMQAIVDLRKDKKYTLIFGCEYFSNIGTKSIIYGEKNKKWESGTG